MPNMRKYNSASTNCQARMGFMLAGGTLPQQVFKGNPKIVVKAQNLSHHMTVGSRTAVATKKGQALAT